MWTPEKVLDGVRETLDPVQPLVIALLVLVIAVAVWAIVQKDSALRTFLVVWFLAP